MPYRDGQGPRRGSGRRGGGAGAGGYCVCPYCGARKKHKTGTPCYHEICPKCGHNMAR